jgi:hypothetical protein
MRPTSNFVRAALTSVAALALLTACSGGSSDDASPSSTSAATTGSPAATSTPAGPTGADAAFCSQVGQLVTQLGSLQTAQPAQVPPLLQQLVTNFDAVQPPAAVQTDWQALGTGLHQLQTAAGSIDVTTPQGQAQLAQLEQQATAAAAPVQGNISAWVLSNCGAGSSATTSATAATTS